MATVPITIGIQTEPKGPSIRIGTHSVVTDLVQRIRGLSHVRAITRDSAALSPYLVIHYENGQKFRVRVDEITHPADIA
jgi:hypothetical protein